MSGEPLSDLRPRLFLVTPPLRGTDELPDFDATLRAGDVACLLLRLGPMAERSATELVKAFAGPVQDKGIALLVEDARMAARAGADGAHVERVGQALGDAIASLKPGRIVGIGGLASRDDAMDAGEAAVDYVMFGDPASGLDRDAAIERVAWWAEVFTVPCVGWARTLADVAPMAKAGAEFIALCEAVWEDARGPAAAVAEAQAAIAATLMATPAGAPV